MKPTLIEKIKWQYNKYYTKYLIKKYTFKNNFCSKIGIEKDSKRDKKLIISMTTFTPRYSIVHLTIESLLDQSIKPDKIILWLYDGEASDDILPEKILKLKKRGLEIRYVNENLKPYKKLIYSVRDFPNDVIVTADDDTIYPNNWLEKLYNKHLEKENKNKIIGYRFKIIEKKDNQSLTPYGSWNNIFDSSKPLNTFFTGVGGVLYPPYSLHDDLQNSELILKLCPHNDDIWFKAMAILNNTHSISIYENSIEFPTIEESYESGLFHINSLKNDSQLHDVFTHYGLFDIV